MSNPIQVETVDKRKYLLAFLVVILILSCLFVIKAFASEPKKSTKLAPKANMDTRLMERQTFARTATTTTTTTTTTTAPKPVVQKETKTPVTLPAPKDVNYVAPQGNWVAQCHAWAAQAGIELPPSAITLIDRESDCSPTVKNPNSSAGGIPQALPWTKMGCPLEQSDEAAVCQLKWMHGYVMGRFGGWDQAKSHSDRVGWY